MADTIVELKNLGKLVSTIERKFGALTGDPAGRALRSVGEVYMTESKRRTPVDTGVLRSSGHVVGPEKHGDYFMVRLVFGGPAAPYAFEVHENLSAHHDDGQAKYLESVIVEHKPTFRQEVATMMIGGARTYGVTFRRE